MRRRNLSKWVWASGLAIGAMSLPTYATITVDGTLNESDYGSSAPGTSALATQTINDSFGVNTNTIGATTASDLDAAYMAWWRIIRSIFFWPATSIIRPRRTSCRFSSTMAEPE